MEQFLAKLAATGPSATQSPLLTLELSPPRGTNMQQVIAKAQTLVGLVDAINVPDCQRALLRMSSLVTAALIQRETGLPTVWQLTARDRNVLALQSDLLGGHALGLRALLCLTGDPVAVGDHRGVANQVSHLEAVGLLQLVRQMNQGSNAALQPFRHGGTAFVAGAALNPANLRTPAQRKRLAAKIEAGAVFFQTQPIYTPDAGFGVMEAIMQAAALVGVPRPNVLLGFVPPKSADQARLLNATVPGITIPAALINRLEQATQPALESLAFCAELAHQLKERGCPLDGLHLMPVAVEKHASTFAQRMRQALDWTAERTDYSGASPSIGGISLVHPKE